MQVSKDLIKRCKAKEDGKQVEFRMRFVNVRILYESTKTPVAELIRIVSSRDAYKVLKAQYDAKTIGFRESFYCAYLNRANRVIAVVKISEGTMTQAFSDPKLIMMYAIGLCATGIIISHNHPSGNTHVSESDKEITKQIKHVARLLDINLLDHIVVTPDEGVYYSFADEGML